MTEINATVTTADRDAARTAIRAILQETQPTLDLSIGGVVDSVIVEGNVDITAQQDANVDAAYLQQQMQAIANGEVEISDEQMDSLASNYFITREEDVPASGDIDLIVQNSITYDIPQGYQVTYGDSTYITQQPFTVYPPDVPGIDFTDPSNIRLQSIYDQSTGSNYRFRIPVECQQVGALGVRVSGDVLQAVNPIPSLQRVEAAESFSGGTTRETNAELAARVMQGITVKSLGGGQDQISALAASLYPNMKVSAVGVESAMQTRGRINPFGINTGGKLDVYAKSGFVSQTTRVVSATVTDFTLRQATLVVTREQAAGAYSFDPVGLTGELGMTGGITVISTSLAQATIPTFSPEMQAADLLASANVEVTIVIQDDRQAPDLSYIVDMTSNGQTLPETYGVVVSYMAGVLELADAFYADANRPPGLDVIVKAGAPCTVTLNIAVARPVNYNGPSATELSAQIALEINQLAMRLQYLDDYTISQIIKDASSQLSLISLTMSGSIAAFDGSTIPVSQTGNKLVIPTMAAEKVSFETVFFTTTTSLVTVTLV